MNIGPVDYASDTTPDGYRCGTCGATGCKLWREYQTFLEHQSLSCCDCAGASQKKDVSAIDAAGNIETDFGRCDQIGWRVPAVPTEEGGTFWGYTSVPEAGCAWWKRLPTRAPSGAAYPEGGDAKSWSLYVKDVGQQDASAPHVVFDIEVGDEP